jgi:hypothetical protein
LRILHVLDHSLPLQSGYAFRTLSILRRQREMGWEPVAVTSPKHRAAGPDKEDIEGFSFYRTPAPSPRLAEAPVLGELALMPCARGFVGWPRSCGPT